MKHRLPAFFALAVAALLLATVATAQTNGLVSSGSPANDTPQNHQNEPAVAMHANSPNILVAGSNDFVDNQACPNCSP
jgi:hypothetical protein